MRTATNMKAPEPGYYPNFPERDYHSIVALAQSEMKAGITGCMADYKAAVDGPPTEPSADMILGTLAGLAIFQPDKYARCVVDGPINPKTKEPHGAKSEAYRDFAAAARGSGKIVIGGDHRERVRCMAGAVLAHPLARKLVAQAGDSEAVAIWDEPIPGIGGGAGVRCKAAADRIINPSDGPRRIELKSTGDASPEPFSRKINDLGYHIQEAWYNRGFSQALGVTMEPAYLIVVQNCERFTVRVGCIRPAAVELANDLIDEFLVKYHAAKMAGNWPDYGWSNGPEAGYGEYVVEEMDIPKWAYAKFADGQ